MLKLTSMFFVRRGTAVLSVLLTKLMLCSPVNQMGPRLGIGLTYFIVCSFCPFLLLFSEPLKYDLCGFFRSYDHLTVHKIELLCEILLQSLGQVPSAALWITIPFRYWTVV